MPCSFTRPRGESTPAVGSGAPRAWRRSRSLPPVPCRVRMRWSPLAAGRRRCGQSVERGCRGHAATSGLFSSGSVMGITAFLDGLARGLEPRRQLERAAQLQQRLVDVESGGIGRDLEQHAARLAEVDAREVLAVDDLGDVVALLDEFLAPLLLRRPGRARGRRCGARCRRPSGPGDEVRGVDVDERAGHAGAGGEPGAVALLLDDAHPEVVDHEFDDRALASRTVSTLECWPRIAYSAGTLAESHGSRGSSAWVATSSICRPSGSVTSRRSSLEEVRVMRPRCRGRRSARPPAEDAGGHAEGGRGRLTGADAAARERPARGRTS